MERSLNLYSGGIKAIFPKGLVSINSFCALTISVNENDLCTNGSICFDSIRFTILKKDSSIQDVLPIAVISLRYNFRRSRFTIGPAVAPLQTYFPPGRIVSKSFECMWWKRLPGKHEILCFM